MEDSVFFMTEIWSAILPTKFQRKTLAVLPVAVVSEKSAEGAPQKSARCFYCSRLQDLRRREFVMATIKQVTRSLTPVLGVGFAKINAVIYSKVCGCHIVKWAAGQEKYQSAIYKSPTRV